jgi:transposase
MNKNLFIRAEEVAKELGVSKPYAYKLIRKLNEELKNKGFITISGEVNRQFFEEKIYGIRKEESYVSLQR